LAVSERERREVTANASAILSIAEQISSAADASAFSRVLLAGRGLGC
jgi:hypothetical protein